MIAYTDYGSDGRVRRYAETLARRGDEVDVISHFPSSTAQAEIKLNGVTIHHVSRRDNKNESALWMYALHQLRFLVNASAAVYRLHSRKRYDVIHIHNIPDFLVFAAWYPKLTGAKLILDIHDIVPELYENKFSSRFKKLYVAALRIIERLSVRFVDHVIISNHLWRDKLIARSADGDRCSVVVNHVDPNLFTPRPRTRNDGKFVVLFPGSMQWHQGLDIGIRAFSQFRKTVPNAEFHIYSSGNEKLKAELRALAQELGIEESVKFFEIVSLDKIVEVIANSDLGVVPKRADSFGNEAYSTKIMEFMSLGVPVVVSRTKIDSYYFKDDDVRFFPSSDSSAMAKAMIDVAQNKSLRESLIAHGLEYVAQHSWAQKRKEYLDLIDDLIAEHFHDDQPKASFASTLEP
jgi:glycosyltransferase involved in cell wall biosynthesis